MMIELMKSRPSEVAIAVPLMYSSGPDAFEYVFKNSQVSAVDFLRFAFVRKGGEFSYDNHYSLYLDGHMVGIGSAFGSKKAAAFPLYDALNILRFYGIRSLPILKQGLQIEKILELPKKKEIALAHLGIQPGFRGQGLGTKLIMGLMEKAIQRPGYRFVLDVSEENPKAMALYERLGFITTHKVYSSLQNTFSYVPNHYRMEWNHPS